MAHASLHTARQPRRYQDRSKYPRKLDEHCKAINACDCHLRNPCDCDDDVMAVKRYNLQEEIDATIEDGVDVKVTDPVALEESNDASA